MPWCNVAEAQRVIRVGERHPGGESRLNSARAFDGTGGTSAAGRGSGTPSAGISAGSRRLRRGLLAAVIAPVLLLATACGGSSRAATGSSNDAKSGGSSTSSTSSASSAASASASASAPSEKTSSAVVSILPQSGAVNVATTGALKVTAASGRLTAVKVVSASGTVAAGTVAADGGSWTPTGALRTDSRYAVSATAVDADGLAVTRTSSFTTMTPSQVNAGVFNVAAGATYGVGMEVSINFNQPVAAADRAAVQQAITVSSSPSVPVVGHWFGDDRIDYRPQSYWAAGTQVVLHMDPDGVETSPGVYDTQYKDVAFSIGRNQVSVANSATHMLTIYRNGVVYRTYPATLGDPDHATYNGIMVISQKYQGIDMNAETVGLGDAYNIPDVPHAMRLTTSGTFIHGNYWRPLSTFGTANTSHGCVGLHDVEGGDDPGTPAGWLYANSLIGDVVQVVDSTSDQVQPDNGWNGWNMSWADWTSS